MFNVCFNRYNDDESFKENTSIVFWTGGWDSTALLHKMAVDYGTKEKPIVALSIKSENISQFSVEEKHRKVLKDILLNKGLHINFQEIEITTTNIDLSPLELTYAGLAQPNLLLYPMWELFLYNDINICLGYVKEDDIWHYISEFKKVFYNMAKIQMSNAKLYLPLEWVSKDDIMDYLNSIDLFDYTWYCEYPDENGKPCNECASCKKVNKIIAYRTMKKCDEDKKEE